VRILIAIRAGYARRPDDPVGVPAGRRGCCARAGSAGAGTGIGFALLFLALLARGGIYRRLYELQFAEEESEGVQFSAINS